MAQVLGRACLPDRGVAWRGTCRDACRLTEVSDELAVMSEEFAQRSPRPSQPRTPPWELMSGEEAKTVLAGLRAGASAEDMHRLLLGVSHSGCSLLPWIHLLGACRSLDPAGAKAGGGGGGGGPGKLPRVVLRSPCVT